MELNIKKENSFWFTIEELYRVPLKQMLEWDKNEDSFYIEDNNGSVDENPEHKFDIDESITKKIRKFKKSKEEFIKYLNAQEKKVSLTPAFFTDVLMYIELELDKDLTKLNFNEVLHGIRILSTKGVFSSSSKFYSYTYFISLITKWAYDNHYRKDFITTDDITSKLTLDEMVNQAILSYSVMTTNEMMEIADTVQREQSKIWIYGILEGLDTIEILSLKREDFKQRENHPIETSKRVVNVSDKLYSMLYDYAKQETVMRVINAVGWFEDNDVELRLHDTDYVIRPVDFKDFSNKPIKSEAIATAIKKELANLGLKNINLSSFRQNAMMNDLIDCMSLNDINKKYNVKYQHETMIRREAYKFSILEDKRRQEGTYKKRPIPERKGKGRRKK
jgi:integrase